MVFNSNTDILNNIRENGDFISQSSKKATEMNDKLNKNNIDDSKQFKKLISIIKIKIIYLYIVNFFLFYMKKHLIR